MTTTQLTRPHPSGTDSSAGALTDEFLAALRNGYRMNAADRACHNAVTNNDTKSLALNRGAIRGGDGHFSHRIHTKGITNQQKSGHCWIFSGLNVLRPQVIRDHRMEEFEFSIAYLQFWDKIEKANLYLESIIEFRDADFLDRDWEMINKFALEDGGWWNYLVGLVGKYGVMPLAAMPETHASTHTDTLNEILGRSLRSRAVRILEHYADGAGTDDLRTEKNRCSPRFTACSSFTSANLQPGSNGDTLLARKTNPEILTERKRRAPKTANSLRRSTTPRNRSTNNMSDDRSPSLSASTTIRIT